MTWSLQEKEAVYHFLYSSNPLRSALETFLSAAAEGKRRDCAQAMATVPRHTEQAADDAAKADVYEHLLDELSRVANKVFTGPTGE